MLLQKDAFHQQMCEYERAINIFATAMLLQKDAYHQLMCDYKRTVT